LAGLAAGDAADLRLLDGGAVGLAEVDAEDRVGDAAAADRHVVCGDVNARRVAAEIAASAAVHVEALDRSSVRTDEDDTPGSRTDEARAPDAAQRDAPADPEVAAVGAGADLDRVAVSRGVDPGLKRREVRGRRPSLDAGRRGRGHLVTR